MNVKQKKQPIWVISFFMISIASSQIVYKDFPVDISLYRSVGLGDKPFSFHHKTLTGFTPQVTNIKQEETPLIHELGYIFAQQVAFGGLSYLASRDSGYGPYISGGFDVFIGAAGAMSIMGQASPKIQLGYAALTAGFLAKTAYTFKLGDSHSMKKRFWVSYLAYNALIYFGYYLDSL